MREILASIDIGSSKIKLVVAEIINDNVLVLCALEEDSRGVVAGEVIEPADTEYAIKILLKKAQEKINVKITKAIISVSESSCEFQIGEASVTIQSPDKEILTNDIVRVLQMSVKGHVPDGNDLITVIPIMFKVDDRKTRIPKNAKGDSLSVKSVVVSTLKRDIYVIAKCLEKCGIEIVDIMTSSIGEYYAHKNEFTDTTTGVLVSVGAETTKISIFNKGIIINNSVLKLGGNNIDSDISYIYKLKNSESKRIKETLALANRKNASAKEKEMVVTESGDKVEINQSSLTDVVMSRLHEILNMAKTEINYLTKKEISYIIITGGLTELKDFDIEVESVFGKNAYVGKIQIVGARDNKYAGCIGMIKYFDSKLKLRDKEYSVLTSDDIELLCGTGDKKMISSDSILGKVFGIFFDN